MTHTKPLQLLYALFLSPLKQACTRMHIHCVSSSPRLINAAKLLVVSISWSAKLGVFYFGASVEYSV